MSLTEKQVENSIEQARRHLIRSAGTSGIGVVRVSDGHVYSFSATALRRLLAAAEADEDGIAITYVQHGPTIDPDRDPTSEDV